MKPIKFVIALVIAIILISCVDKKSANIPGLILGTNPKDLKIVVQPIKGLPKATTNYIVADLKKVFANVQVNPPIELPKSTLNEAKTRHRAILILDYLKKFSNNGAIVIGLTNKDISATKGKINDWGVMGLSYRSGITCVASIYRLKGKNRLEKFTKVAIHELGHTQGLPHCVNRKCLMRSAQGKDRFNEVSTFCTDCKSFLQKKGWVI